MDRKNLIVPPRIRYLGDWKDYNLDNFPFPHILNKSLTGCGFTEYCLCNQQNLILVSPRRILLENKKSQHPEENVLYARNDVEKIIDYEKDLSSDKPKIPKEEVPISEEEKRDSIFRLTGKIKNHYESCEAFRSPCKILVTYDSFRHVREALISLIGLTRFLNEFQVVVDEFQSIFVDAKFKSDTEIELLYQLQDLQKVCFVSATPMLDKYLDKLDEFKNLPYFEMDWGSAEPGRVKNPEISVKIYRRSLTEEITRVIGRYQDGKFETRFQSSPVPTLIESKEAVFYVNSVKTICSVIKKLGLTPDNTNVLCARTLENEEKVRKAFGIRKERGKPLPSYIGSVPKKGEPHKMFTFCTRTVYLGADFYSTCARTFVFSDANIDCLSVDISIDLEQILGRQRLDENPWKNTANLYIKYQLDEVTYEEFMRNLQKKIDKTKNLLRAYETSETSSIRHDLAETYEKVAKTFNYKDDYVSVNKHSGSDLKPVFNNLMLISEERAYEVQQIDYKNRFTVFNALDGIQTDKEYSGELEYFVKEFNSYTTFVDRMKYLCRLKPSIDSDIFNKLLTRIPSEFENYITSLGISKIGGLDYQKSKIVNEFQKITGDFNLEDELSNIIHSTFEVGKKYSKSIIKQKLGDIYKNLGYSKTAKAVDLEKWFIIKSAKVLNKETGERDHGFEILEKK